MCMLNIIKEDVHVRNKWRDNEGSSWLNKVYLSGS